MGLAGAGRTEQDDVLAAGQEVELAEVQDGVLVDRALEAVVELLQRLSGRQPGGLDAGLAAVAVAAVDPGLEQDGRELLVAPLLRPRTVRELGRRASGGGRLQRAEQVRRLRRRPGHAINWS
jgi:hypothetical protein